MTAEKKTVKKPAAVEKEAKPKPLTKKQVQKLVAEIRSCKLELQRKVEAVRDALVERGDLPASTKVSAKAFDSLDKYLSKIQELGF